VSPLPKNPQRGDSQRLQQLASGLKLEGGTHGAVVQRNDPGRPTGSTGIPAPRASNPQNRNEALPDAQKQMYASLAQAEWVKQYWTMMNQRFPGPRTEYALARAEQLSDELAQNVYKATPNFEF
jgi:hypothetical protein